MRYILYFLAIVLCNGMAAQGPYLLVGTYSSANSDGIYVYRFNEADGTAIPVSHIVSPNASYLALLPGKGLVYAVNENADSAGRGGAVSGYRFNGADGTLRYLGSVSSEGNHPCYIAVDSAGRWAVAGNYSSGNFSVIPLREDGSPAKAVQVIRHTGSGPDSLRQRSAHVHCTYFDPGGKRLYVADLGTDLFYAYRFNPASGYVTEKPLFTVSNNGGGPRHLEWNQRAGVIYIVEELTGQVLALRMETGESVSVLQMISTLPDGYKGPAGSADIHLSPDGHYLYVSNRGESNTIALFKVKRRNGKLVAKGHFPTLGDKPRNFTIDPSGKYLLAANQQSDEIVVFRRNKRNGKLSDAGQRIKIGRPVCLKWFIPSSP